MKISNSVSTLYNQLYPEATQLKKEVDIIIHKIKDSRWHYFSRVKTLDSFALKLETGRVADPKRLEDFFAGTLVVQNLMELRNVELEIEKEFEIVNRRPNEDHLTHKESSDFPFDDLRLYIQIRHPEYLPPSRLSKFVFELQIKTFLQHAWSISTHDLIYKSNDISWAKERVAFQVRAMLEQAEIAISGAEQQSNLPELAKSNKKTNLLIEVMSLLKDTFNSDQLPDDLNRLTRIILDVLSNFKLTLEDLKKILFDETALGRGVNTLDLSPYSIIIESIKNQKKPQFEKAFKKSAKLKTKYIFIPKEINLQYIDIEDNTRLIST